jgi:hypothetical protein
MQGVSKSDNDYFARRAAQEDAAATAATHPLVREVHLELAKRYRDACRGSSR